MTISGQNELVLEAENFDKSGYAILKAHALDCSLSKLDRRILADLIQRADTIGTGVYLMLARLLSKKLLYAPVVKVDGVFGSIATVGSNVTFSIDSLGSQAGRLFHGETYAPGQRGIPVASLLGATLIGMNAGTKAPFLQADGSFRTVRLISVAQQPATQNSIT